MVAALRSPRYCTVLYWCVLFLEDAGGCSDDTGDQGKYPAITCRSKLSLLWVSCRAESLLVLL